MKGDQEQAIATLRRAIEAGFDSRGYIEWDPDLASIRSDPRFGPLVAQLPEN